MSHGSWAICSGWGLQSVETGGLRFILRQHSDPRDAVGVVCWNGTWRRVVVVSDPVSAESRSGARGARCSSARGTRSGFGELLECKRMMVFHDHAREIQRVRSSMQMRACAQALWGAKNLHRLAGLCVYGYAGYGLAACS